MTRFALAATAALALLPVTLFATPAELLEAARNNDTAEVLKQLDAGLVNSPSANGVSALHVAAGLGYTSLARLLVQHGADLNARSALGKTPLMLAAQEGHTDIARLLVAAGARTDLQDTAGATALTWARGYGHRDIVTALNPIVAPRVTSVATWKWLATLTAGLFTFIALHGTRHHAVALLARRRRTAQH